MASSGRERSYLDEEEPSPAGGASDAPHVQEAVGQQSGQDVGDGQCRPEEAQPDRELVVLVKVGEV